MVSGNSISNANTHGLPVLRQPWFSPAEDGADAQWGDAVKRPRIRTEDPTDPNQGRPDEAASANGLPSESRQTAHRSPGWTTEPPSSSTSSSALTMSPTVK